MTDCSSLFEVRILSSVSAFHMSVVPQPTSPSNTNANGRNPDDFIDVGRKLVTIEALKVHTNHLEIRYSLDDGEHHFLTKVMYPVGTLASFQSIVGAAFADRIFCHIALIETLKFIAVFPRQVDITKIAHGLSQTSLDFFTTVSARAWSQHMYEVRGRQSQ